MPRLAKIALGCTLAGSCSSSSSLTTAARLGPGVATGSSASSRVDTAASSEGGSNFARLGAGSSLSLDESELSDDSDVARGEPITPRRRRRSLANRFCSARLARLAAVRLEDKDASRCQGAQPGSARTARLTLLTRTLGPAQLPWQLWLRQPTVRRALRHNQASRPRVQRGTWLPLHDGED